MQISKLEMRILLVIAAVIVGILAVVIVPHLAGSAPAAQSSVAGATPTPAATEVTPTLAPTPTPTPTATTEQQILDNVVATTVSVYSVLVCSNLNEYAALSIPEIISRVLAEYPTTGLSDQSRQVMAERVLTESAAKSCTEQSARVAAGI